MSAVGRWGRRKPEGSEFGVPAPAGITWDTGAAMVGGTKNVGVARGAAGTARAPMASATIRRGCTGMGWLGCTGPHVA